MTKATAAKAATTKDAVTTTETNDSSLPLWKEQHNRVQGAMWQHDQDDGTTRFTVSISRSYKDRDDDKWKSVHYFDRKDLKDVRLICDEAEEEILRLQNLTQAVDED